MKGLLKNPFVIATSGYLIGKGLWEIGKVTYKFVTRPGEAKTKDDKTDKERKAA